jgi:hypothetical protein
MKRLILPLPILIATLGFPQTAIAGQTKSPPQDNTAQANASVHADWLQASSITGYYNVRTFGALGIGTDDETESVQAALTKACALGADNPNGGAEVFFPAGVYPVHGLQVSCTNVLLRGAGPNTTVLQYNGSQNSGTYPVTPSSSAYILAFAKGGSWGGLRDMEMNAYTVMQPVTGIATDLVLVQGAIDADMSFDNLAFSNPIHDAIHVLQPGAAFNPETMGGTRGYVTARNVATTSGTGTGMTVNITASEGQVTAVSVASPGSGYQIGDDVAIAQSGSDGKAHFIVGANTIYFNWFMHQIRFDGTGGYGIHIEGLRAQDGSPFAMDGFTWTTLIAKPDWLLKNGYLQSFKRLATPWGKGVIGLSGGFGYQLFLTNGRVEGGYPQIPVGPGQEANLFADEMPVQPSITLHFDGSSVTTATIDNGGFGWNGKNYQTTYTGCTRDPKISWIVSNSVIVGAKVADGGSCTRGATAKLFLSGVGKAFIASNIIGFISSLYQVPLIYSPIGTDSYSFENVQISGNMGNYMNGRTGAVSILGFGTGRDEFSGAMQRSGWSTQGHSFFSIPYSDIGRWGQSVTAGDIVFHDSADYRSKPWGQIGAYQVVTYPIFGTTMLRAPKNLCSGGLTPSGNTWSGCSPTQLRAAQVSVNSALSFPSGGPSSASLDTYVTAVDWSTGVITTAVAGSNVSQIDYTTPQLRDSWTTGTTYPASATTIYYRGEVVYNSAPAGGKPIWWSCSTTTCTNGAGWIAGPQYGSESVGGTHDSVNDKSAQTPSWLQYLGTGADGACTFPGGSTPLSGERYCTTFNVSRGAVVTVNSGLVVHATGSCTVDGAILANGAVNQWAGSGIGGASSGGSGGGTNAGATGKSSFVNMAQTGVALASPGQGGVLGGGNGESAAGMLANFQRAISASGMGLDGLGMNGAPGVRGANSGGLGGEPGAGIVLICKSISGAGVIDVSGGPGNPPAANATGAGSGGGGGVAILSSQAAVSAWPTINTVGGAGGQASVPYAVPSGTSAIAAGNSCTAQPKLSLGVSGGALASCTVVMAGAGCGSAPNVHWTIMGGAGSGGTITPTWSGGTVRSCTASGGSGYQAASYRTAGTGGDGGNGWYAEFAGW